MNSIFSNHLYYYAC